MDSRLAFGLLHEARLLSQQLQHTLVCAWHIFRSDDVIIRVRRSDVTHEVCALNLLLKMPESLTTSLGSSCVISVSAGETCRAEG